MDEAIRGESSLKFYVTLWTKDDKAGLLKIEENFYMMQEYLHSLVLLKKKKKIHF